MNLETGFDFLVGNVVKYLELFSSGATLCPDKQQQLKSTGFNSRRFDINLRLLVIKPPNRQFHIFIHCG